MVLEPQIFDYISGDDTVFEQEPLERLAQEGQLVSAAQLMPSYLRQPQAVRERLAREADQTAQSTKKE